MCFIHSFLIKTLVQFLLSVFCLTFWNICICCMFQLKLKKSQRGQSHFWLDNLKIMTPISPLAPSSPKAFELKRHAVCNDRSCLVTICRSVLDLHHFFLGMQKFIVLLLEKEVKNTVDITMTVSATHGHTHNTMACFGCVQ